jgi:diaminohydroxyphosphoribosylaminopyrimidine deaminase/5-amino-6-(5-phosphoribosylamino)uracil reductase
LADNPDLTVRHVRGISPRRIVLDSRLRIPYRSHLVVNPQPEKTIVATSPFAPKAKVQRLQRNGVTVWLLKPNKKRGVDLSSLLAKAATEGITSILVEGGADVYTAFLRAGLADRVIIFVAPKFFGTGRDALGDLGVHEPGNALAFRTVRWTRSGSDLVVEGRF